MKKLISILAAALVLVCAVCAPVLAEDATEAPLNEAITDESYEDELTLSGSLLPSNEVTVTAPFGGAVLSCGLRAGDMVSAGDALFELDTKKVYAPADGVIAAVLVAEGQGLADTVYAAPIWLEPASPYIINATVSGANNATETKYIHAGERVHVLATGSDERSGNGIVTSVSGTSYTVEVLDGNLRIGESCNISRSDDPDDTKLRIGSGRTTRNDPIAIAADGSVLKLHVKQGDTVKKGALLMETVSGDIMNKSLSDSVKRAEADCVITSVSASVGMTAQQGQPMLVMYESGTLEAVVRVDEDDLIRIAAGDKVVVEPDCASGEKLYDGVVRAISYVSAADEKGVAYKAYVTFENDGFVRQGMSVTVRK